MKRVLIMMPNNPGDVLMVTPALRRLKLQGNEVHFLVDNDCVEIVAENPNIDKLHVLKRCILKKKLNSTEWKEGLSELTQLIRELKNLSFDMVINCFQGEMTAIIAGILDVADTRGQILGRNGSLQVKGDVAQLLYAVPFARKHVPAHAADFYSLMAGVESDNKGFDFFVPDNSKKMADDLFKTNNLVPAKTIVLHPGSAHKKKMWPVENYAELIKLVEESGFSVVITGVSSEKEIANKIIQFASSRSAINICGVTSISESAAIIAKAFCFISGDTFTMHVAASVGTKTIALFAPTSPLETGPYSENAVALVTDCLCYGNYEGECRMQRSCISKIKPEFVLKFVTGDHVACDKDMAKFYAGLDLQKGFVDYLQNNVSEYSSVSRALLSLVSGKKVVENNIPDHEYRLLKRFYGELLVNIALLSRMRGLKDNGQINELVAQNAQIERNLNLFSGISSLLSAWLRIKNNNISSSSFLELVNGLLENSRSLSVVCEQLVLEIERGENVKSWFWPKVKLFCIERGRSSEKFASLIEYPSLMLFDGDDTKEEYVLVADTSIHPDPGIIYCMVSMMLREKNIAGCCAKIMNSDDTVNHAGYILQKDASLKSHAIGNSRFSKAATEVVNIDSAEPLLVIFRRSVVEELLLDKFDKESILALKKKNHSLIYCPDAEAYA